MRKFILRGVLMSALVVAATACGPKSENATNNANQTEVATPAEESESAEKASKNVAELNTDELLKYYSELVDEYAKLAPKAIQGDTSVQDRFAKIANELGDITTELQKRAKDLTPEQLKLMTETAQRMASAISE